jgi:hypothetical protein
MSCCNNKITTFTPLSKTWTKSSSVSYGTWDPYPELRGPFSDYKACATCPKTAESYTAPPCGSCNPVYYNSVPNSWKLKMKYEL